MINTFPLNNALNGYIFIDSYSVLLKLECRVGRFASQGKHHLWFPVPRLYCLPVLFTGEIRNLAQAIQPPGYSLWFHCIASTYANVISQVRFLHSPGGVGCPRHSSAALLQVPPPHYPSTSGAEEARQYTQQVRDSVCPGKLAWPFP